MSIIDDALKKTQLVFTKADKVPEKKPEFPPNQSVSNIYEKLYKAQADRKNQLALSRGKKEKTAVQEVTEPRPAKKWLIISSIIIVWLFCSYGGYILLSRLKPFQGLFRANAKNSSGLIVRQTPKKRHYKPGELILNGTSLIDGKRVALINDEIYQVGETVNGKKITSISLNKIELSDNEKIITLKLR
jgi:hypothetical protein